jgi:transcriptional regulator with XRE-family HTH domain
LLQLREAKNLSQGDIEQRTGLLRCYVSRLENGHTGPSLEALQKLARALEVPLYQPFYEGEKGPEAPRDPQRNGGGDCASSGKGLRLFTKIQRAVATMNDQDRSLILRIAEEVGRRKPR